MRLLITFILLTFILFSLGCKQKPKELVRILAHWEIDFEDPGIPNKKSDAPYEGKFYSFADPASPFTYGIYYPIPDSINGYIRVSFDFYARIKNRRFGQSLIVSVSRKDSMMIWHPFNINNFTFMKDKWVHVVDSMQFFKNPTATESILKVFGFHAYQTGELDIDNLKVQVKTVQPL